jgi:hypothetical protein
VAPFGGEKFFFRMELNHRSMKAKAMNISASMAPAPE